MHSIASIRKKRGSRDRVVIEFEPPRDKIDVALDVLADARLRRGDAMDDEAIAALLGADLRHRCRRRAWGLLARRPRSRAELAQALRRRGFPAAVVEEVVARLEQQGHIDDARFAETVVQARIDQGRAGPRLVRRQLSSKGVGREIIEEAVAPLRAAAEQEARARETLRAWMKRSGRRDETPRKRRERAAGHLLRRGFDSDVVWEAVRDLLGREEEAGEETPGGRERE